MESVPSPLGICLRQWREHRGLTVRELARRCGYPINTGTIGNLESGRLIGTNDANIVLLAEGLGIRATLLFGRANPAHLSAGEKLDDIFRKYSELPEKDRDRLAEACLDQFERLCEYHTEMLNDRARAGAEVSDLSIASPSLSASASAGIEI